MDEWHILFPEFDSTNWPLQSVTTCLPKAPFRSRSSTQHLSYVLQEKDRCYWGEQRQNNILSFLNPMTNVIKSIVLTSSVQSLYCYMHSKINICKLPLDLEVPRYSERCI